jgi:hypothetical protein
VVEEGIVSQRHAHFHGRELVYTLVDQDDVEATTTRELQHLLPRCDPRRTIALLFEHGLE